MSWKAPALFLSLAAAVLALLWLVAGREEEPVPIAHTPMEPVTLAVATDTHFIAPTLTDNGESFTRVIANADGKVMRFSSALMEAFFAQIESEHPDALILSGDLTFNGARESHEAFAACCAQLQAAGVPVLVLPGNHDLNSLQAARFHGDTYELVDGLDAEGFRRLYAPFGYDDALSEDEHSLSYVCALRPGLRLLFVDCNTASEMDTVPAESFDWIESQLKDAAEAGDRVIAVSHQTVLQHNSRFAQGFVITNRDRLLRLYRKYHVSLSLCGHMHLQHWKQVSGLTEILTGALSVQPCEYGVLHLSEQGGSYETCPVDVSAWARAQGRTEPELLDFSSYALAFHRQNTMRQHPELSEELLRALADLNAAYFAGRLDTVQVTPDQLRGIAKVSTFMANYVESLTEELGTDFTRVTFTFQE